MHVSTILTDQHLMPEYYLVKRIGLDCKFYDHSKRTASSSNSTKHFRVCLNDLSFVIDELCSYDWSTPNPKFARNGP
jgi:hypothetical protein